MILVIAGTRDLNVTTSDIAIALRKFNLNPSKIISGECKGGADLAAKMYALEEGIPYQGYPPGKKYYPGLENRIRNGRMSVDGDQLLVIWDGYSKGTKHMIECMEKLGKKVHKIIRKHGVGMMDMGICSEDDS